MHSPNIHTIGITRKITTYYHIADTDYCISKLDEMEALTEPFEITGSLLTLSIHKRKLTLDEMKLEKRQRKIDEATRKRDQAQKEIDEILKSAMSSYDKPVESV